MSCSYILLKRLRIHCEGEHARCGKNMAHLFQLDPQGLPELCIRVLDRYDRPGAGESHLCLSCPFKRPAAQKPARSGPAVVSKPVLE